MAVGTSPLWTPSSTCGCRRLVVSCRAAGDRVGHPACCAMVWAGLQSLRVWSPQYSGQVLKWSQVPSSEWVQMHLVYSMGMGMESRVYHLWCWVRSGSCSRASWSWGFCRCVGRLSGRRAACKEAVRAEGRMQGGTHRRRCTHKPVHTQGGLWPPQES